MKVTTMEKKLLFIALISSCYSLYSVYNASDTADVQTIDEYKVKYSKITAYEKSVRDFLKLQTGIVDTKPKTWSEMSLTEMLFSMNPWKEPEPINVCDDKIPCLFSLLLKQKYDFINSHIRDFAATYGCELNKYHVFLVWLSAIWATKILTMLVFTVYLKINLLFVLFLFKASYHILLLIFFFFFANINF